MSIAFTPQAKQSCASLTPSAVSLRQQQHALVPASAPHIISYTTTHLALSCAIGVLIGWTISTAIRLLYTLSPHWPPPSTPHTFTPAAANPAVPYLPQLVAC